jgi:dienelactone hydrolase
MIPARLPLPCLLALGALAFGGARAADPSRISNLRIDGERWSYEAAGHTIAGFLLTPKGAGPFAAVIINHGKGGRPEDFSLRWAREVVQWGLVCICPTLTHVAGTAIQGQDGASAENIARIDDCFAILAGLGSVDRQRVAVVGHSMGAFATIAFCGTAPTHARAAVVCAGGVTTREGVAMPPVDLAARITAPTLIVHGTVDGAVAPPTSAQLERLLAQRQIACRRVLFEGTNHDLPTNPATRATVLALIREWFVDQGVLAPAGNTPPTVALPADLTIRVDAPPAPLALTVGDRETSPEELIVSVATSYPRLLPAANIVMAGSGAQRTLQVAPVPGEAGRTTIFVTASDGQLVTTRSFVLSVADATGVVPPPVVERPIPGRRGGPPKK